MKQTKMLIQTLREVPRDADVVSQQLMMRAGMIQKLAAGIYDYLPLALRSIRKFEQIVREELAKDGCQELLMPTVQPAELWQESTRWSFYGKELLRLKDRKDAEFCLGPTHEEVITDIVRKNVRSYKQLPMNLFQVQTKFRDEIRPRFGLMRGREFIMKDGYSFHVDDADADKGYWEMFNAYKRIFSRLGVKFRPVEADSGAIGGSFTHEFHVLAGSGEDGILSCDSCEYTSNVEKTEAPRIPAVDHGPAQGLSRSHFRTPGITAMEEQAKAFKDDAHDGLPLHQTSKVYWLTAEFPGEGDATRQVAVACVLRGDHELNPVKVKNYLGAADLQPMADGEDFCGAAPGFLGPLPQEGTRHWALHQAPKDALVYLVDRSLEGAVNLTCGANVTECHHFGFDPKRDLPGAVFLDLRMAQEGDLCPRCGKGHFQAFRGIEVGQVFKLGTKYSRKMNCVYVDEHGKENPMVMGCYGIGITRTVAAAIEQNYDADGIVWPWPIAPYQVHLLDLDPGNGEVRGVADGLERDLEAAGFEVLHDDREGLSPGAKFKDADLLGFPLRVMVGSKGLKDGVVELKDRRTKELRKVQPAALVAEVMEARDRILRELEIQGGR
ncbi:proline--tRNA ligase [Mesoterricola silvestris]|uniref:Proline--tRNA ligase n=1 Tax=Mesoterricola silvestris TaxID=2927979 RepID=A0AA48K8F9_9BACT|nr:proline--tRNA ligase [Mesoterricola silvestris]BDU72246.1 proline--tRNA ligase [Mesoterricola silvestris]